MSHKTLALGFLRRLVISGLVLLCLLNGSVFADDWETKPLSAGDIQSVTDTNSPFYDPVAVACAQASSGASSQTSKPITTFPTATATVQQKIAQTLMVGIDVNAVSPDQLMTLVKKFPIGGIYFTGSTDVSNKTYSGNYDHFDSTFFDALNKAAGTALIIASDEEGATSSDSTITPIHRFAYPNTTFPTAKDMGSQTTTQIENIGSSAGQVMRSYGITTDLAPVLDLDNGRGAAAQSVISKYGRSFSSDPNAVAADADAFARGLQESGVSPVFKHFPGLGSAWNGAQGNNTDAYKITGPSLANLKTKDLIPYQKLANKDNAALMLSNEYIPEWDGGTLPVSESPAAIKSLQTDYKFTGLIMTDSLSGPASYQNGGSVAAAVTKAEQAGADMPLFDYISGGKPVDIQAVIDAVRASSVVATGTSRLDASITKILNFKNQQTSSDVGTTPGGCCDISSSTLTGSDYAHIQFNFFKQKGFSDEQAAGVVGNSIEESVGVDPKVVQDGYQGKPRHDEDSMPTASDFRGAYGYGIAQWTSSGRQQGLLDLANQEGKPSGDIGLQLDFMWHEATTSYQSVVAQMRQAKTVEEAETIWENGYENPGDPHHDVRLTDAQAIYNNVTKGTPMPPNIALAPNNGLSKDTAVSSAQITDGCGVSSGFSGDAAQLAQQMLAQWGDGKTFSGNSGAYDDLQSTVQQKAISYCKGSKGTDYEPVGLDPDLLRTMLKLGIKYKLSIGSFLTGHDCDNKGHPRGWAVDIMGYTDASGQSSHFCNDLDGGDCPNATMDHTFFAYLASIAPQDSILNQAQCAGRGNGVKADFPSVQLWDGDTCNHEHFNVHQSKVIP